MAKHVHTVTDSDIPKYDKPAFWAALKEGRLLFCSGSAAISHAIEQATNSPWSHIAMVIKVYDVWCVLEAIYQHGVTITPMWQYIDRYEGDLVLCRRIDPTTRKELDYQDAVQKGLMLLGRDYATLGLVKQGLHRIFTMLPAEMNDEDCYCSGLQWIMSTATPYPFSSPQGGAPAPEDEWNDATVEPIGALLQVHEAAKAATV